MKLPRCFEIRVLTMACVMAVVPEAAFSSETLVQELSRRELVERLDTDAEISVSGQYESDLRRIYDVVVEEIFRRGDIEFIPLLIGRVNDETIVKNAYSAAEPFCAYEVPVRVKHKVRFILKRLLSRSDFTAMFGDGTAPEFDQKSALEFFVENQPEIATRFSTMNVGIAGPTGVRSDD